LAPFPVEIRFFGELIDNIGIGFQWWDGKFPSCLKPEGFFPMKGTKMEVIRSLSTENGIIFEVGKDGRMLRTAAAVWIFPTTEEEDAIMTVAKECGGPDSFFDKRFRVV